MEADVVVWTLLRVESNGELVGLGAFPLLVLISRLVGGEIFLGIGAPLRREVNDKCLEGVDGPCSSS